MIWRGKVWLLRKINQKTDKDFTANAAPDTTLDKTSRVLESYFIVKRAIWSFLNLPGGEVNWTYDLARGGRN